MTHERFKALLEELDGASVQTLVTKNAQYSSSDDTLHNFTAGGEVFGGTPAQACWGYLTKHLVALRDMVQRNDFRNRADLLEKCQDSINYIRFLWCIANEEMEKYTSFEKSESQELDRMITRYHCKLCDSIFALGEKDETFNDLVAHLIIKHGVSTPTGIIDENTINQYFEKEYA